MRQYRRALLTGLVPALLLAFHLIFYPIPAAAQRGDWVLLGSEQVGFRGDNDFIRVGRQQGPFDAIRLHVRDNDIYLRELRIHFAEGPPEVVPFNVQVRAGSQSAPIPLRGGIRRIEQIELSYQTTGRRDGFRRGRATVDVYGEVALVRPEFRNWVMLGSERVGFRGEVDEIQVPRDDGRYDRLRLRVRGADVRVREIRVTYGRGDTAVIPINADIPQGGVSPVIEIPGGGRRIHRLELVHRARGGPGREGIVEVWAERARGGPGPGPGPGYGGGGFSGTWTLLGEENVGFNVDRDVMHVGRDKGRFRALKLKAIGHAVRVHDIKVHFGNGDVQDFPVRVDLRGGQETPPIDLQGDHRAIDRIELIYQTKLNLGGTARMQVLGLR